MRSTLRALAALIVTGLIFTPSASADLQLTLSSGGQTVNLFDNGSGFVSFFGSVGAWSINVTTGVQIGTTTLDLDSVDVLTGTAAAPLVIQLSGNNMRAPGGAAGLQVGIGGAMNAGFNITYGAYIDTTNTLGGLGTQIGNTLAFGTTSFAGSTSGSVSTNNPFTINQVVTLSGTGRGLAGFDADVRVVPVPDGAVTVTLLGGVLVGLGALRRRRRAR